MREFTRFQINKQKAFQEIIIENQVDIEMFVICGDPELAANE
jgi:hypothetical protein